MHGQVLEHPGPVGGGVSHGFFFTNYSAGPFESAKDVEEWFNERQRVCKDLGYVCEDEKDFSGIFDQLVVCHMDLHMDRIIVDPQK